MGNFSRDTFDKLKHYVCVRLQQGVPLVDADWNEKDDIRKYEMKAFLKWFVGDGVPLGNHGFEIVATSPDPTKDFMIRGGDGTTDGAGRCLVDGWDAINESDVRYSEQILTNQDRANALGVDRVEPLSDAMDGVHTVYLDMWEREVTPGPGEEDDDQFIYDRNLINEDIGLPTCTRIKREWVVRVVAGEEAPEPEVGSGHVHYPLAHITLRASQPIYQEDITDLRRIDIAVGTITGLIQADRWVALPPYNFLWPLWSPRLSPPHPLTGDPTPLVTEIDLDTILPVQPCLIWDPVYYPRGPVWLLYNIPPVIGGGLTLFDDIYGLGPFPPNYLRDPVTGIPRPISLPPGYETLSLTIPKQFALTVNIANLSYSLKYGLSADEYNMLLSPTELIDLMPL